MLDSIEKSDQSRAVTDKSANCFNELSAASEKCNTMKNICSSEIVVVSMRMSDVGEEIC